MNNLDHHRRVFEAVRNEYEENQPHTVTMCRCDHCEKRWVEVAPVGVYPDKCPDCGKHPGIGAATLTPSEDGE